MKINEVEKRTGITCHNIRFYEKENLVTPKRNPINGYREYTEADIEQLNRIKFLRLLDIPVKSIRDCLEGKEQLSDILNSHIEDLDQEENRIKQNLLLCQQFADMGIEINDLSENVIGQIFNDREAYSIYLNKIKKKDKIKTLFFISEQIGCIICCVVILIGLLAFYANISFLYMNRFLQVIMAILMLISLVCIIRIVYYNEKYN